MSIVLYSIFIILYYIILCYIILYYIILYYIILYCIVLHYIILYYIVLYYIILYYIILCYIILYYILYTIYYILYIIYISVGISGSWNGGTVPYKTIFCGDIPLHRPYIGLIYGRYPKQFRWFRAERFKRTEALRHQRGSWDFPGNHGYFPWLFLGGSIGFHVQLKTPYWCVLRREWMVMGEWALLGWLLLVIMDHSRRFPTKHQ